MVLGITSVTQLPQAAHKLLDFADQHKIFLFFGDMGSGKTTFIKSICKKIGVNDLVSSPTFSIINEYSSAVGPVYHFDFYRLKNEAEAFDLGLEEYLYAGNYCFIEWPEKIIGFWPARYISVNLKIINQNVRQFEIDLIE